ncbi:MAG: hypothetical protein IPI55_17370 [Flavobacteriales bacterium]|nr:hypothetical protein [Flavobacteriales bacterium]
MGADLDGDARPLPALSNPEIGADETTAQCAALSGTYIIGPSVAADRFNVQLRGECDDARAGSRAPCCSSSRAAPHRADIVCHRSGNSATNTITFRGQALDSAAVMLEWPTGATAADNWAVRMTGADYVRLEHLTLQRTGTDLFGDVVSYAGTDGSRDLRITRCHLNTTTNGLQQPRIISAQTTFADDSLVVLNTRFQGGSFAVFASTTGATDHVRIEDCV